ncbi:UNVERIFIED_CONTAM: hypothetical protein Sangu_2145900 [Sesamum angustifolium]|uniref:Uncharacterized protein n=1 Tax=Sesamum angustifolium TaxID=2727405 RepID=A0AAW2LGK6_9LAMI
MARTSTSAQQMLRVDLVYSFLYTSVSFSKTHSLHGNIYRAGTATRNSTVIAHEESSKGRGRFSGGSLALYLAPCPMGEKISISSLVSGLMPLLTHPILLTVD